MQDFLRHIPSNHIGVSSGFVETLIQSQRNESFTGLMYLQYPSSSALVFTFLGGIQQKLYRLQEQCVVIVERQSWEKTIDLPDATVSLLKLTEDALRFLRLVFESPILRTEKVAVSRDELSDRVREWCMEGMPAILQVSGEKTDKLYLIAGNSAPVIEELSWTGREARFSVCDANFPTYLPQAEYRVVRTVSDNRHRIWQEYELRFAFSPLMRIMINRFSELAGRALTERLCEQISQFIRGDGMNIVITVNGVANHHYFNTLEDASSTYLKIIQKFREEAGTAIGLRMADGITRETLLKLDKRWRELLQRYIIDQYVLDNGQGMAWR